MGKRPAMPQQMMMQGPAAPSPTESAAIAATQAQDQSRANVEGAKASTSALMKKYSASYFASMGLSRNTVGPPLSALPSLVGGVR